MIGTTGIELDVDMLDDTVEMLKDLGKDFADFVEVEDDDSDDECGDWGEDGVTCMLTERQLVSLSSSCSRPCCGSSSTTGAAVTAMISSERSDVGEWKAVSKSTPLADLFDRVASEGVEAVDLTTPTVAAPVRVQDFNHEYREVLSDVCNFENPDTATTPVYGSASESAPHTW